MQRGIFLSCLLLLQTVSAYRLSILLELPCQGCASFVPQRTASCAEAAKAGAGLGMLRMDRSRERMLKLRGGGSDDMSNNSIAAAEGAETGGEGVLRASANIGQTEEHENKGQEEQEPAEGCAAPAECEQEGMYPLRRTTNLDANDIPCVRSEDSPTRGKQEENEEKKDDRSRGLWVGTKNYAKEENPFEGPGAGNWTMQPTTTAVEDPSARPGVPHVFGEVDLTPRWDARAHYASTGPSMPHVSRTQTHRPLSRAVSSEMSFLPAPASGRYLYMVGGIVYNESTQKHYVTNQTWRYDKALQRWESLAPLLKIRALCACCTYQGRCVVAGGCDEEMDTLSSIEWHNPRTDEWTRLGRMYNARDCFSIVVSDGHLLGLGGFDHKERMVASVERYDASQNCWVEVSSLLHPRASMAVVAIDGYIFAMGGYDENGTVSSVCERWDPVAHRWDLVAPMLHPRAMCAAAVWDGMIYVSGGKGWRAGVKQAASMKREDDGEQEEGSGEAGKGKEEEEEEEYLKVVEKYDPQGDEWSQVSPLLLPRALHKMVVLPTNRGLRLCAVGGFTDRQSLAEKMQEVGEGGGEAGGGDGEGKAGGEGERNTKAREVCLSSSEYYDKGKDEWESCDELELPYPCAGFDITTV